MGGLDSPAATRSTAAVMRRSGLVRLATATAATSRPKNAAATITAIKSGTTTLSSVSNPAASKIAPKTATGRTAATINPAVSTMRIGNSKRLLRAGDWAGDWAADWAGDWAAAGAGVGKLPSAGDSSAILGSTRNETVA